jgi:hypothetical protein
MLVNVVVEGFVGAVPLVGDLFDVTWSLSAATCGFCASISSAKAWSELHHESTDAIWSRVNVF